MNNLIIVSNTSPITSLAAVGQLNLLKELYQRIIIPETVYQRLRQKIAQKPPAIETDVPE